MRLLGISLSIVLLVWRASAVTYQRTDQIIGAAFNDAFIYQSFNDPSHGRVDYVNQTTAASLNLTFASSDTFILRTDFTNVVPTDARGRKSVRIISRKTFTTHVAIFDVRHMPVGCGTWPAIWEVKENGWPNAGEVDIVEGVHGQSPNQAALHTSAGCTMPNSTDRMTGTWKETNCNTASGCNVGFNNDARSFGPSFNKIGGGIFAFERTPQFMKVWFFARGSSIPPQVLDPASTINTDTWKMPTAYYPNTSCDFASKFKEHNIIINLTLCGDWAGSWYPSSCPLTCKEHVNSNPAAFTDAYWDFKSVNLYAP